MLERVSQGWKKPGYKRFLESGISKQIKFHSEEGKVQHLHPQTTDTEMI